MRSSVDRGGLEEQEFESLIWGGKEKWKELKVWADGGNKASKFVPFRRRRDLIRPDQV